MNQTENSATVTCEFILSDVVKFLFYHHDVQFMNEKSIYRHVSSH